MQLEKLVEKWFFGTDHPLARSNDLSTTYTYQTSAGSLFSSSGIRYQDIVQGNVGDCYFMTALSQTALRSSSTIQNMFIANGDNTWTVRFWYPAARGWTYLTVDNQLPVNSSGHLVFADMGRGANDSTNVLWPALAEKAYAEVNEEGWIGQDGTNSYNGDASAVLTGTSNNNGINGGWAYQAINQVTGQNTTGRMSLNLTAMVQAIDAGKMVALSSDSTVTSGTIDGHAMVHSHAYGVVGYTYDTTTSQYTFTLYNPWGFTQRLTWQQIQANFSSWDSN
jgi:ABC-type amino acid transport substrate-binding protein